MTFFLSRSTRRLANLAVVVVLPEPCRPTNMIDAGGTGLAAPQVHVPLRVILFQVATERGVDSELEVPLTALINPMIENLTSKQEYDWESCLSVPGLTGLVPRCHRIRYSGITPKGDKIDRVAEGFHARVVQHEYDHLEGITFNKRVSKLRWDMANKRK